MKVFSTNLALTRGIYELEASETGHPGMVQVKRQGYSLYLHGEGKDWHRNRKPALTDRDRVLRATGRVGETEGRSKHISEVFSNLSTSKPGDAR